MSKHMEQFDSALDIAVKDWFKRQCANPSSKMYLYYKPEHNAFWLGEEPLNETWVLATGEPVSNASTIPQVFSWAKSILGSLPTLPRDE